jgi:hypothetical protein
LEGAAAVLGLGVEVADPVLAGVEEEPPELTGVEVAAPPGPALVEMG